MQPVEGEEAELQEARVVHLLEVQAGLVTPADLMLILQVKDVAVAAVAAVLAEDQQTEALVLTAS
jgi:hypothetical protein